MTVARVRWAVLGTANIAARSFLPAIRAAGDTATVVGSRDPHHAREWAEHNEVGRTATYEQAITADDVDAIYIALPNDEHARWAARAVDTGRAVLCEKPLGLNAAEVDALLAGVGPALLWEAFVFPFHPQTALLAQLAEPDGPLGGLREIISEFHFTVASPENLRFRPEHGGGALLDVGCYPIRLARELFGADPSGCAATAVAGPSGVDMETAGALSFPDDRRLLFSSGMRRAPSTFTRLIGVEAELRVSNPFHPTEHDGVELWRAGKQVQTWESGPTRAFEFAVRHIADVLADRAEPQHLAARTSAGNARALDLVRASAAAGPT